jgi:acetyl esterase
MPANATGQRLQAVTKGDKIMQAEPQTKVLLEQMAAAGAPSLCDLPVTAARAALKELSRTFDIARGAVDRTEDRDIPGPRGPVPIRIYWPVPKAPLTTPPILLLFHGGGYALGDIDSHDHMARHYCARASVVVINVGYRLSPENKFPSGVEDCYAALEWAARHGNEIGANPARIAVTGDSAGGTFSAALCQATRTRNGPPIAFQALVYPALDLSADANYPSRAALGGGEYFISMRDIDWIREMYFTDPAREGVTPLASPIIAADLSGQPPALIVTAGLDPLVDEGRRYHERLTAAGVASEYRCFDGTIHGFLSFAGALAIGREGLDLVADRIAQALHG